MSRDIQITQGMKPGGGAKEGSTTNSSTICLSNHEHNHTDAALPCFRGGFRGFRTSVRPLPAFHSSELVKMSFPNTLTTRPPLVDVVVAQNQRGMSGRARLLQAKILCPGDGAPAVAVMLFRFVFPSNLPAREGDLRWFAFYHPSPGPDRSL